MRPSERIYFHTWSVGEACGSDKIPGCRDAAIDYLTNTSNMAFDPREIAIFVTVGLSTEGGEPVDLTTEGLLRGKNYTQANAVCRPGPLRQSEAAALTLMPGFTVVASGGGCLGEETLGHKTEARAFVAALVTTPPAKGMLGGEVKGCPKGLCIIGLASRGGSIASSAADTVKKVCGEDVAASCTVAAGDFGAGEGQSSPTNPSTNPKLGPNLNAQFHQLGIGKVVSTQGFAGARAVTNVGDTGMGMDIGPGYPLRAQFGNVTGQSPTGVLDVLLPCAYPQQFEYCKK
jgi:hypothetical protein